MKNLMLLLVLVGVLVALVACGGSDDEAAPKAEQEAGQTAVQQTEAGEVVVSTGEAASGAAVVMASCGKCHSLDKVCAKIGTLDKAGWAVLIARMVQKGCDLDRQAALGAAEFLADPALAKPAVCN